jgi:hypothetical protein
LAIGKESIGGNQGRYQGIFLFIYLFYFYFYFWGMILAIESGPRYAKILLQQKNQNQHIPSS